MSSVHVVAEANSSSLKHGPGCWSLHGSASAFAQTLVNSDVLRFSAFSRIMTFGDLRSLRA